jgi:hypothetical protein
VAGGEPSSGADVAGASPVPGPWSVQCARRFVPSAGASRRDGCHVVTRPLRVGYFVDYSCAAGQPACRRTFALHHERCLIVPCYPVQAALLALGDDIYDDALYSPTSDSAPSDDDDDDDDNGGGDEVAGRSVPAMPSTMPRGIPRRVGYVAARDTVPSGI